MTVAAYVWNSQKEDLLHDPIAVEQFIMCGTTREEKHSLQALNPPGLMVEHLR